MTDLGNGLFAISIPKESEKLLLDSYGTIFYRIGKKLKTINTRKENHQILGTVTKDNIDFDVAEYCDINRGNIANKIYFRELLSSKGMHFVNPCGKEPNPLDYLTDSFETDLKNWKHAQNNLIEKLVIIKKV